MFSLAVQFSLPMKILRWLFLQRFLSYGINASGVQYLSYYRKGSRYGRSKVFRGTLPYLKTISCKLRQKFCGRGKTNPKWEKVWVFFFKVRHIDAFRGWRKFVVWGKPSETLRCWGIDTPWRGKGVSVPNLEKNSLEGFSLQMWKKIQAWVK